MATDAVDDRAFLDVLFRYLLRSSEVAEKVLPMLREDDFYDDSEVEYQVLTVILKDYWDRFKKPPGQDAVETELLEALQGLDLLTSNDISHLATIIEAAYGAPVGDTGWVLRRFQQFLEERRLRPMVDEMQVALPGKLAEHVERLEKERAKLSVVAGQEVNIFSPATARLNQVPRKPTGVPWFDALTGGGLARGKEVLGLMAPPSGGKTMGCVQLASELVLNQEHVLLFTYETEFEPEYSQRFYSYLGQIPRNRIAGRNLDQLNPDDRNNLFAALERCNGYLHTRDMVGRGGELGAAGGINDIRSELRKLSGKGIRPSLVIIDQLLPMVDRHIAQIGEKLDNRRVIIQQVTYAAVGLCAEFETNILFLHQLDTQALARHPSVCPSMGDAAECKSFAFWLNFCMAFGTRDKENRLWAVASKARSAAPQQIIVQMNADMNRIEYEPDRFTLSGRDFVDTASDDGEIPREKPRRGSKDVSFS